VTITDHWLITRASLAMREVTGIVGTILQRSTSSFFVLVVFFSSFIWIRSVRVGISGISLLFCSSWSVEMCRLSSTVEREREVYLPCQNTTNTQQVRQW